MLKPSSTTSSEQEIEIPLILVVDDDEAVFDLISQVLAKDGHIILKAKDGHQCLELFHQFHPALVLLDIQMPGMDGITCCETINTSSISKVPILMMSSLNSIELIDRAFAAGATDYLIKPFHLPILQHRVKQFLQQLSLEQQIQRLTANWVCQTRLYQTAQQHIQDLELLHQRKDDFLSTVCHELRAPLSNIRLAIQMLTCLITEGKRPKQETGIHTSDSSKINRYLRILSSECEREVTLLNNLLDLQRLEVGTPPHQTDVIYLDEWLNELTYAFIEQAQQRQQTLQLDISPGLPALVCDPISLNRILTELLYNACKYTPPGESIVVAARTVETIKGVEETESENPPSSSLSSLPSSRFLQLSITNFGVEIPAEEIPRIFERFYQGRGSDRCKQSSTGLGLTLVQKLVEHIGGTIRVTSTAKKTCFTVMLPFSVDGCIESINFNNGQPIPE